MGKIYSQLISGSISELKYRQGTLVSGKVMIEERAFLSHNLRQSRTQRASLAV